MRANEPGVESEASPRFETVDLLRGLSILAVVLLHCRIRFFLSGVKLGSGLPHWLQHLLLLNGGNGVTIFFAISGFLITLTSVRRFGGLSRMRPGWFYRIRFARIAPLLLLVLAVLSLLHWGSLHWHAFDAWHVKKAVGLPKALFSALTFHLNWLEGKTGYLPANWDVMWSLSVEEMFCLLFRWSAWAWWASVRRCAGLDGLSCFCSGARCWYLVCGRGRCGSRPISGRRRATWAG
jgi:peptidoglycan/LPS O-acetylase OafA/YrhL